MENHTIAASTPAPAPPPLNNDTVWWWQWALRPCVSTRNFLSLRIFHCTRATSCVGKLHTFDKNNGNDSTLFPSRALQRRRQHIARRASLKQLICNSCVSALAVNPSGRLCWCESERVAARVSCWIRSHCSIPPFISVPQRNALYHERVSPREPQVALDDKRT